MEIEYYENTIKNELKSKVPKAPTEDIKPKTNRIDIDNIVPNFSARSNVAQEIKKTDTFIFQIPNKVLSWLLVLSVFVSFLLGVWFGYIIGVGL